MAASLSSGVGLLNFHHVRATLTLLQLVVVRVEQGFDPGRLRAALASSGRGVYSLLVG